jgi:hypothetical protein
MSVLNQLGANVVNSKLSNTYGYSNHFQNNQRRESYLSSFSGYGYDPYPQFQNIGSQSKNISSFSNISNNNQSRPLNSNNYDYRHSYYGATGNLPLVGMPVTSVDNKSSSLSSSKDQPQAKTVKFLNQDGSKASPDGKYKLNIKPASTSNVKSNDEVLNTLNSNNNIINILSPASVQSQTSVINKHNDFNTEKNNTVRSIIKSNKSVLNDTNKALSKSVVSAEPRFDRYTPRLDTNREIWENTADFAKQMITQRREKLLQERELLNHTNIKGNSLRPRNDISSLYSYQNLNQNKNIISHKAFNQQMMDPIYYPLEMPLQGEPVKFPNIDYGQVATEDGVIHSKKNNQSGFKKEDALALMAFLLESGDFELGVDFENLTNPKPLVDKSKKDIKGCCI